MVGWLKILGFVLLLGGALAAGPNAAQAATSATLDILPDDTAGGVADTVDLGRVKPISNSEPGRGQAAAEWKPAMGHPALGADRHAGTSDLLGVPASAAARRGRPAGRSGQRATPEGRRAGTPLAGADRRRGRESDAIAVSPDQTNQKIVRLHQGESHAGWQLSSVQPREVTLKEADRTEVLALKRQDGAAGVADGPAAPGLVVPAAAGGNTSFAPFLPRSIPKNGESDGL